MWSVKTLPPRHQECEPSGVFQSVCNYQCFELLKRSSSAPASSVGGASSVRLFTGYHDISGPIIGDLDEDLDNNVEVRDLSMYDSSGYCNMASLSQLIFL